MSPLHSCVNARIRSHELLADGGPSNSFEAALYRTTPASRRGQ
jgi:hypothetical protein